MLHTLLGWYTESVSKAHITYTRHVARKRYKKWKSTQTYCNASIGVNVNGNVNSSTHGKAQTYCGTSIGVNVNTNVNTTTHGKAHKHIVVLPSV